MSYELMLVVAFSTIISTMSNVTRYLNIQILIRSKFDTNTKFLYFNLPRRYAINYYLLLTFQGSYMVYLSKTAKIQLLMYESPNALKIKHPRNCLMAH